MRKLLLQNIHEGSPDHDWPSTALKRQNKDLCRHVIEWAHERHQVLRSLESMVHKYQPRRKFSQFGTFLTAPLHPHKALRCSFVNSFFHLLNKYFGRPSVGPDMLLGTRNVMERQKDCLTTGKKEKNHCVPLQSLQSGACCPTELPRVMEMFFTLHCPTW